MNGDQQLGFGFEYEPADQALEELLARVAEDEALSLWGDDEANDDDDEDEANDNDDDDDDDDEGNDNDNG